MYLRARTVINVAVRLGMVSLPAATLNAALRTGMPAPPGTAPLRLAWRALLASRAFALFVPALSRRSCLLPQVRV